MGNMKGQKIQNECKPRAMSRQSRKLLVFFCFAGAWTNWGRWLVQLCYFTNLGLGFTFWVSSLGCDVRSNLPRLLAGHRALALTRSFLLGMSCYRVQGLMVQWSRSATGIDRSLRKAYGNVIDWWVLWGAHIMGTFLCMYGFRDFVRFGCCWFPVNPSLRGLAEVQWPFVKIEGFCWQCKKQREIPQQSRLTEPLHTSFNETGIRLQSLTMLLL